MAQTDRDILFSNEAFLIGMLQAVTGGALVAAIAQSENLLNLAGRIPLLVFFTAMAVALISAILSAYWKHQYKLWDVKAQASAARSETAESHARGARAKLFLGIMRLALVFAVILIVLAVGVLIGAFWIQLLCPIKPA